VAPAAVVAGQVGLGIGMHRTRDVALAIRLTRAAVDETGLHAESVTLA
jgi:hypothetical protein